MKLSTGMRASLGSALVKGLTFACFRKPGAPITLWAQRTPELENVDKMLLFELNDVFLVAPFDMDPEHLSFVRSDVELVEGDLEPDAAALDVCEGSLAAGPAPQSASSEAAFRLGVDRIKQRITDGILEKTVLSRLMTAPLPPGRIEDLFEAALAEQPDAFVALVHTPDHGTWLGASPERLLHAEEDHVSVDAIAGTRSTDRQSEPWGTKETHEQEVVTTEILKTFVHLRLQEVLLHGPETITAGVVQHLRSTVEADLGENLLADVLVALHPTPAVCGLPRAASREILRTLEVHHRGLYTGFWGPWSADGITDLYVNLRCMQLFADVAVLHVGAGITAGSDADKEWMETAHKARTMQMLIERLERSPVSSTHR